MSGSASPLPRPKDVYFFATCVVDQFFPGAGLDAIHDGQPRTVRVDLTEAISMNSLGVCGGIMNVFVEVWGKAEGVKG